MFNLVLIISGPGRSVNRLLARQMKKKKKAAKKAANKAAKTKANNKSNNKSSTAIVAKSSMAAVATKPSEMKAPPVAVDPNHQYSAFNNFKGAYLFVVI